MICEFNLDGYCHNDNAFTKHIKKCVGMNNCTYYDDSLPELKFNENYIILKEFDKCVGCSFKKNFDSDLPYECEASFIIEKLFDIDCSHGYIFKKKKEWVHCTKDNIKVGDIVRNKDHDYKYEIKYIINNNSDGYENNKFIVKDLNTKTEHFYKISDFEKEI